MSDFQVPQFIEDESKLVGPFSFVQIFILVGGCGIALLVYNLFIKIISIPIALIIVFLTISLATLKVHDFPLYKMLIHIVKHFVLPKSYLWKQPSAKQPFVENKQTPFEKVYSSKQAPSNVDSSQIEELSKILDKENEQ